MNPTMLVDRAPQVDVQDLRSQLTGRVVSPGDADWDVARQAWNLAVDQRPALVALPETAQDIASIVKFARKTGLRVAPQGTGHNPHALELEDAILVKTSSMQGIEIDPVGMTARVDAGVVWGDVTTAAAEHGLAALAGSSPDVGVVGYTLGGGISWLGRRYGLASNSVLSVELVDAAGEIRHVDRETDPDLFWAIRGGGGNFGVVTSMEFLLYPVREVYAGALFFPADRAAEVLHTWRATLPTLPDHVTSIARLLNVPPLPDVPEPLRGRSFVVVEASCLVGEAEARGLLQSLRDLGPEMDTFATVPVSALQRLHMDPEHPVPGSGHHVMLRELTAETVEAFLEVGTDMPLLSMEIRHLGGAIGRAPAHGGALGAIDAPFAVFGVGMVMSPEMGAAVNGHLDLMASALAPWDAGSEYLNFAERKTDPSRMFSPANYERLLRVKARVDADDVCRANHRV